MKRMILSLICLVSIGCHKENHHVGQGMTSLNPSQEIVLVGAVDSDVIIVNDPRIQMGSDFTGIVIGSSTIQMPYFLTSFGTNVYFHVEPTVSRVIIFNAKKANSTSYKLKFDI